MIVKKISKGKIIVSNQKNLKNCLLGFLFLLTIDQISKILVRTYSELGKSYKVIGNFFRISRTENQGIVFGISLGSLTYNKIFFTILTFIAIIFLIYLFLKSQNKVTRLGFTFILSGAFGNLIDRIARGAVTDFLDFDFFDFIVPRWYTFNIADSCIVIGIIILMIYYIFIERSPKLLKNGGVCEI